VDAAITKMMGDVVNPQGGEIKKGAETSTQTKFKEILDDQLQQTERSTKMVQEILGLPPSEGTRIKAAPAELVTMDPERTSGEKRTSVVNILSEVNRNALQMDEMIEIALSGQKFTPESLLAMQAGVLQITLEIEFVGQTVSSAEKARNQLWNVQV